MKLLKNIAASDTGYLFNPTNGDSFASNAVATDIIILLKQYKTIEEISDAIILKYEVDRSTFRRDLDDFMHDLKQNNLISEDED